MRKTITIRKLNLRSVFRTVLMCMAVPYLGLLLIAIIRGAFNEIFPVIFAPLIQGAFVMLMAASYNWLAPRFGGLVIEVHDQETD